MTFSVVVRISSPRLNLKPDNIQKLIDFFFETLGEAAPTVTQVGADPSLTARLATGYKAHINSFYVEVTANEDRIMTASQTNWLYVQLVRDINSEVTGAQLTHLTNPTEPAAPTDSVLVAKITTDATDITTIDVTVAWLNTNKKSFLSHSFQHKKDNGDEIDLNELGLPTANIDFNQQQVLKYRVENLIADPVVGNIGRLIYRTDLTPKKLRVDNGTIFEDVGAITLAENEAQSAGADSGTAATDFMDARSLANNANLFSVTLTFAANTLIIVCGSVVTEGEGVPPAGNWNLTEDDVNMPNQTKQNHPVANSSDNDSWRLLAWVKKDVAGTKTFALRNTSGGAITVRDNGGIIVKEIQL